MMDTETQNLIEKENSRQKQTLELIASENYTSPAVREALTSLFGNKYSEGTIGKRYYGGNEVVDELESLAIERAKKLFNAEHANVQPLSGSPANLAVYMAFLEKGDKVLSLALDHGGHLSHGHPLNFSGKFYDFSHYHVRREDEMIDMDEVRQLAKTIRPKMIVVGFSAYSRNIPWQEFKDIADEVGAITFADIAHIAGLIAGGQIENPVPIFDVVSTTTHKTLRGPRGGVIFCKSQFAKQIDKAVFPGVQGGPHDQVTAAKAVAFAEAATDEFKSYSKQVILNAQALSDELVKRGVRIISGGTDNHIVILDVRASFNIGGGEAQERLEKIGLSVNKNLIPFDEQSASDPSGIRIGTAAITTRGMKEEQCRELAGIIYDCLNGHDGGLPEVSKLAINFPIPK